METDVSDAAVIVGRTISGLPEVVYVSMNQNYLIKRAFGALLKQRENWKANLLLFDFLILNNEPKIVEISYCFPMEGASDDCRGYWDSNLNWYNPPINLQSFMIEDFIKNLKIGKKTL